MQLTQEDRLEFGNSEAAFCKTLLSEFSDEMRFCWVCGLVLYVVLVSFYPFPFQIRNRQQRGKTQTVKEETNW